MRLIIISQGRFVELDNGRFYGLHSVLSMFQYKRYLDHFDEVLVFARTRKGVPGEVMESNMFSGERIKVIGLPYFVGPAQFLKIYYQLKDCLKKNIKKYVDSDTVVICRVPSSIGSAAIPILRKNKIPYGLEIIADPYDLFAKGVLNPPLRILLRWLFFFRLKIQVYQAPAVLYVTQRVLQERYPCRRFFVGVSDVEIPGHCFSQQPKKINSNSEIKLISIGSLEQKIKSPDIVLKALKILSCKGIKYKFTWVGGGRYERNMKHLADELGIEDRVVFLGQLPAGGAIYDELKKSDIFLLASRSEGLPRAMVEAMACGLPCVGTSVGGIPEILDAEALIPVNDATALANKIIYFIEHPDFLNGQALRNLEKAREFTEKKLKKERNKFFNYLKNLAVQQK